MTDENVSRVYKKRLTGNAMKRARSLKGQRSIKRLKEARKRLENQKQETNDDSRTNPDPTDSASAEEVHKMRERP